MNDELLNTGIKYHKTIALMITDMNAKSATASKTEIAANLLTYLKELIQIQHDLDQLATEDNISELNGKYRQAWAAIDNERKAFLNFLQTRDITISDEKSYQAGLKMINQDKLTHDTLKELEMI